MRVIIFLLIVFGHTTFGAETDKAEKIIKNKYSCQVDILDGYKIKVDEFSSSRILQFKLYHSEFIDKSTLSEAIASDCSLLIIDNISPSELKKYDTIIVVVTKEKVKNYEYRYGIIELKRAKQVTIKMNKIMEYFISKKHESILPYLNKKFVDKNGESSLKELISKFPSDLYYINYGFTSKLYDNKIFYTFSYLLSNKTSKKRLFFTCLFNENDPFICGFSTSDKY